MQTFTPTPTDPVNWSEQQTQLAAQGVHSIFAQFTDMHGCPRGKLVPLAHLPQLVHTGAGFAGPSIWGTQLPRYGARSEYYGRIEPTSLQVLPWWPGVARAVCNGYAGGEKLATCSRQLLRQVLAQAEAQGYKAWVGIEPEFFLLDREAASSRRPRARAADAWDRLSKPSYDFASMQRQADWLEDMRQALVALDFDLLQIDHEDANGQWEINYAYDDMLAAADRYMLFKMTAQTISEKHGLLFCTMPKPMPDAPGSGLHFHLSLTEIGSGKAVFADPAGSHGLSSAGQHFVAGLLRHASSLAAFCAPTVNSYKRLAASHSRSGTTWSPNVIAWGDNNRTAIVRTVDGRLEWRLPDASANVYAALAATLSAGLLGLAERLAPPTAQDRDLYTLDPVARQAAGLHTLPSNLGQALDALSGDAVLRHALGEAYTDAFLQLKTDEWAEWQGAVTDWELQRYARAL